MDKIKMAILATGNIAHTMAKTIVAMEQVIPYGVASREAEKAKAFAAAYGFEKAYGSYEEMLADKEIDLVYIASPHSHHYEHIKMCLQYGKHVLCEKAFTVNAKQAKEVLALAKSKKLLLTEAIWVSYMPMVETLQKVIASGIVGEISTVTANLHYLIHHIPRLREPALAGGALLDVGIYPLTFAAQTLGHHVKSIQATCVKMETGVDLQTSMTLCYEDGKMAVLHCGMKALSDRKGILYGDKGYIIVENINNIESIQVYNQNRVLIETYETPKQITGYEYEVLACMEAIEKGWTECPKVPHWDIVKRMEWMDEIRKQLGIVYPCE